ncbi:unnamed protein product, partial [marine sediment metagenome]
FHAGISGINSPHAFTNNSPGIKAGGGIIKARDNCQPAQNQQG